MDGWMERQYCKMYKYFFYFQLGCQKNPYF